MGKAKTIVKTQYLYVNSDKGMKRAEDANSRVTITIPQGIFLCDNPRQSFKVNVVDFNMTADWYYINETNNKFSLFYIIYSVINPGQYSGEREYEIIIPYGNYTYKALASTIQNIIQSFDLPGSEQITVQWSATMNKYVFKFPTNEYELTFRSAAAGRVLGITQTQYGTKYLDANNTITSDVALKSVLSDNITLWIDNLSLNKDFLSVENKTGSVAEPCTCVLNIVNRFAPFDVIAFENPSDLYSIHVNEKNIESLSFSIRDENGQLMKYVSDWRATIQITTLEEDNTYEAQNTMIQKLDETTEYLRYMFLQNNLIK